jgi:hypothetical protein
MPLVCMGAMDGRKESVVLLDLPPLSPCRPSVITSRKPTAAICPITITAEHSVTPIGLCKPRGWFGFYLGRLL